jgi:replicative DNA helicase
VSTSNGALPANLEAEEALLGSLLIDDGQLAECGVLTAADFYREPHGLIFQAIADLQAAGQHADYVTLLARLEGRGQLAEVGGASALLHCMTSVPSAVYAADYARLVSEAATRRRVIAAAGEIARLAYDETLDVHELTGRAVSAVEAASAPARSQDVLLWQDAFGAFADWQLQEAAEYAAGKPKLTLPWSSLSFVRALQPGSLGIVGGDSGSGKSICLECCAEAWARRGCQVAFFHTELTHRDMLKRRMCRWARLTMQDLDGLGLTEVMQRADELAREWAGTVHYVACGGLQVGQIIARARDLRRRGLCDVMILDYLQDIVTTERRGVNDADLKGEDATALKRFAEQDGVPIMSGSQFNRLGALATTKTRHNLRGSGRYDQKASLVITLHSEVLTTPLLGPGGRVVAAAGDMSPVTTVRVDKQTYGGTGERNLWSVREHFLLTDIAEEA